MISREILLEMVHDGLSNGTLTKADLAALMDERAPGAAAPTSGMPAVSRTEDVLHQRLGVVDVLFYLAGLLMFAALAVTASQLGDQSFLRSTILFVPGLMLWALTYVLGRQPRRSETTDGLLNALLLTGCLAVISGGVLIADQITGNSDDSSMAYVSAIALVLLGGLHLWFDKISRHVMLAVLGMYLLVAAFPTVMAGLLSGTSNSVDVWTLISMGTGALLGYAGVIVSKTAPGREHLRHSFLPVAGFIVLGSVYVAGLASAAAVLWQILLPVLIYGAFFYSIRARRQNFLVTGSFFLALFLISMSFKYFSGLGVSFCLVLSGVSLLATAFLATNINKRYIKQG